MRAGEKLLNALFIFLEHVKTWNLILTTHSLSCFFEVLIVQCQNSIKYILLRSLSAAMFTWPCKTNFTTVPDPLELQILLEDQTATEILFQSYAATTTIDRMTWLACISHYVRGHVHKTGHNYNYNGTVPPIGLLASYEFRLPSLSVSLSSLSFVVGNRGNREGEVG